MSIKYKVSPKPGQPCPEIPFQVGREKGLTPPRLYAVLSYRTTAQRVSAFGFPVEHRFAILAVLAFRQSK